MYEKNSINKRYEAKCQISLRKLCLIYEVIFFDEV